MAMIEWSSHLSVNVASIDTQHQKLIHLINELNDAMRTGKDRDCSARILSELTRLALEHFAMEEQYFAQFGYEDAEAHRQQHRKFAQDVSAFQAQFDMGQAGLSFKLMSFLSDWLSAHIMATDKRYTDCFNRHGLT